MAGMYVGYMKVYACFAIVELEPGTSVLKIGEREL